MMFLFLTRRLALNETNFTLLHSKIQLDIFRFKELFSIRCLSSAQISLPSNEQHPFAVSYLINVFGFSPKAALSAYKRIKFETLERPESVLRFLRDHGFNDTQISITVRQKPQLLGANLNKNILPKFEFLYSIGFSRESLPKFICGNSKFLTGSLKQHIVPCYYLLKSVCSSDDKVITAIRRLSRINLSYVNKYLAVNISILRDLRVPESGISAIFSRHPYDLCQKPDRLHGAANRVIEMGFDPADYRFVNALRAHLGMSPDNWKAKLDVFRRWGLSEDQFWSAFKKDPRCVVLSVKAIVKKMNFLVNKMGWQPDFVVSNPSVFSYSLEKRIVPRCSVVRILLLKGFIKGQMSLVSIVATTDKKFLKLFVNKHLENVPQLMDVLEGKVDIRELGFEFHENCKASQVDFGENTIVS